MNHKKDSLTCADIEDEDQPEEEGLIVLQFRIGFCLVLVEKWIHVRFRTIMERKDLHRGGWGIRRSLPSKPLIAMRNLRF